jgi:hypothetical protein
MILKPHTIQVLKNFSSINQGILINSGNVLRSMSVRRNIFASAPVEDVFEKTFAIYDLNEFLATISLYSRPDLEFKDDFIQITDADNPSSKIKYSYSSPSVVVSPPEKAIVMPEPDAEFVLNINQFEQIIKAASVMKLKNVTVDKDGIKVHNDNSTGNQYRVDLDVNMSEDFKGKLQLSVDNLKIIHGDYKVMMSVKGLCKFTCTSPSYPDLEYFIALDVPSES